MINKGKRMSKTSELKQRLDCRVHTKREVNVDSDIQEILELSEILDFDDDLHGLNISMINRRKQVNAFIAYRSYWKRVFQGFYSAGVVTRQITRLWKIQDTRDEWEEIAYEFNTDGLNEVKEFGFLPWMDARVLGDLKSRNETAPTRKNFLYRNVEDVFITSYLRKI